MSKPIILVVRILAMLSFLLLALWIFAGSIAAQSPDVLADLGFRPEANGFSFENYGSDKPYTNLTVEEMRRIFGDSQVCESVVDGECFLHPQVEQMMQQWNDSMSGGHCYGFSVAALRMFTAEVNPSEFGSANSAADLTIEESDALQREIAYHFAFQNLQTVQEGEIRGTPKEILARLVEVLKPNPTETYTIGFYKRDGSGGHAVTPYAVEDRGNGQVAVLIYDNNYPKETKEILFDTNADTWSYSASINPTVEAEVYEGDAETKTLSLLPTSPGLKMKQASLECPVCKNNSRAAGNAALNPQYNQLYLDGNPYHHAHLLITDKNGKRVGYLPDGSFVQEIADIRVERTFVDDLKTMGPEPTYYIPVGLDFTLTIDGSGLKENDSTDVVMIGPGYYLGVEDVNLDPGQKDTLALAPDGTALSFQTESSESPNIILGFDGDAADYAFLIKGMDVEGGGTLSFALDPQKGQLVLTSAGTEKPGVYGLLIDRIDDKGEQAFYHDAIELTPQDDAYVDYSQWQGNNTTLKLEIDRGGDGTIDETQDLTDAQPSTDVPKPVAPTTAKSLTGTPEWNQTAQALAKTEGFQNSSYEAFELPATTKWDDVFKAYDDQMVQLGWTGEGVEFDYYDHQVGAWVDPISNTGLLVLFMASPDGTKPAHALVIVGLPASAAPSPTAAPASGATATPTP